MVLNRAAWPRKLWTVRLSVPDCKRWVAKLCRRVGEVMRLGIPALPTSSKDFAKKGDAIPFSLLDQTGAATHAPEGGIGFPGDWIRFLGAGAASRGKRGVSRGIGFDSRGMRLMSRGRDLLPRCGGGCPREGDHFPWEAKCVSEESDRVLRVMSRRPVEMGGRTGAGKK
jgi:hypothetical protein